MIFVIIKPEFVVFSGIDFPKCLKSWLIFNQVRHTNHPFYPIQMPTCFWGLSSCIILLQIKVCSILIYFIISVSLALVIVWLEWISLLFSFDSDGNSFILYFAM